MNLPAEINAVAHGIQLAVAPVFLLTAVSGLIGAAAGRLARLTDMLEMEGRDDAALLVDRARRDPVLLRDLEGEAV